MMTMSPDAKVGMMTCQNKPGTRFHSSRRRGHHGCGHARQPECAGFSMPARDRGTTPLFTNSPSTKPGHFRAQPSFVDEDEPCRIEIELTVEPVLTTLPKITAFLLQCMCSLF